MVDFISYNIHNGIIGIKHEGKHIKNTKRLRKPKSMKYKWVQYSSCMVLLLVFREHPCQVCKGTHAPELISHPVNTFVNSVSREHTQLCNLCFHLPLLSVNVGGPPPVNLRGRSQLSTFMY